MIVKTHTDIVLAAYRTVVGISLGLAVNLGFLLKCAYVQHF